MKSLKNVLCVALLSGLIVGCGTKKENEDNPKEEYQPEMSQKVSDDVSALNASISQGVNELKNLNDPNIGEIYNAINSLHADSTINDLNAINTMVFNHLEAIKSGQVNPQNNPVGMAQDDTSLAAQLANAQQRAGLAQGGVSGLKANLEQLKQLNKAQYDEVNKLVQKIDLNAMSDEDLKQLNNIVAKAVIDAKQGQ